MYVKLVVIRALDIARWMCDGRSVGYMQFFSIGIEKQNWQFKDKLLNRLQSNIPEGFDIDEEKYDTISYINFVYDYRHGLENLTDVNDMLSHGIGSALAQFLLYDVKEKLIAHIMKREYFYFDGVDSEKIYENAVNESLNCDERKWAAYIHAKLTECFKEGKNLSLEGFIRFRIKEYIGELKSIIDRSVDELLIDKEYNEFIKLLRYFVEIQEPKIEEVHVLLEGDKKYTLLDSGFRVINNDMLEDLAREISDNDISYDDLLISSLITIAPNKIIIHDSSKIKNTELLNTIKNVFCGKVEMKN